MAGEAFQDRIAGGRLRLWLAFVVATNLGWFPGIALGTALGSWIDALLPGGLDSPALRALAAARAGVVAGLCVGAAQWWVLRRPLSGMGAWVPATTLGWAAGVGIGQRCTEAAGLSGTDLPGVALVAFFGGAGAGVLQWRVLRSHLPHAGWWVPISAVGWGVLFPGAVPGAGLVWLLRGRSASDRV